MTYEQLFASDGTGEAVLANIEADRAIASITVEVDSVENFPNEFIFCTGTKNANNFITPDSMTIGIGHLDSGNVIIDDFAPGYVDDGNTEGQILIIKPTTHWVDEIVRLARVSHEDNGDIKRDAIDTAAQEEVGLLGAVYRYTYASPDIFINGVDQNNGDNTVDWTKPAGLKFVEVECVGGGGGGGGASGSASNVSMAAGGGGGGYSKKRILAADLGATEVVTVGAGGVAGTTAPGNGGNGGNSSFGAHLTGGGGVGGTAETFHTHNVGQGGSAGLGGTGSGGDVNVQGGCTSGCSADASSGRAIGNKGGDAALGFGSGGAGSRVASGLGDSLPGNLYGGGGAGGVTANTGGNDAGGTGAAGIVIIREYY